MKPMNYMLLAVLFAVGSGSVAGAAEDGALLSSRHIARAHYQNEHFARAAEVYRQCVELAPDSFVDRINLAVAEGKARETEASLVSARAALSLDDSYPHSLYIIGLMSFRLGEWEETAETFARLLEGDPFCTPALYAHGQALYNLNRSDEAIEVWERVIQLDPNHSPTLYQLFRYYTAIGDADMAAAAFSEFTRIKQSGLGPGKTQDSIFRYRYFDLLEEKVSAARAGDATTDIVVELTPAGAESGLSSASTLAVGDLDEDGDEDVFAGTMLYLNDGGTFVSVSVEFALPARLDQAEFGDLDNDGLLDLAVIGNELTLLRGNGLGNFENFFSTGSAGDDPGTPGVLRLVDIDHEGDLDLLYAPAGGNLHLLQNNGNGTFTDVTEASGMTRVGPGVSSLLVSDLESDFDIDVLATDASGRRHLFVNERDGTFLPEAGESGLDDAGQNHSTIVGDVNNDGNPDLVFFGGEEQATEVWLNRGDARFHRDTSSPVLDRRSREVGASAGHLVDLDNDGDLDLIANGTAFTAFRNDGAGGWTEWPLAPQVSITNPIGFDDRDFDGDADADLLILTSDGLQLLRNDGGNQNHRIRLRLTGTKNCLDGYGAKVWTRAGRFFQVRENFRRWIDLGVGDRTGLDVVGIRWPTGVTQNEIEVTVGEPDVIEVTERPGLAESCPFVYAFNGERFEFVTDILDVGPLGISLAPGVPFMPGHREAVLISGEQLAAEEDRYSIRVTQELKEITYLDRVELFVIDHPEGSSVLPNDHFSFAGMPPRGLHFVPSPFVPVSAVDESGEDVLKSVLAADRVYANDCEAISARFPGITGAHELILDPGSGSGPLMLFLRATMLWTEASINVAISQNPDINLSPISLDVIGPDGNWTRVREDVGVPAGMDKFLPVDLDGLFATADRRVRLSTNMAVLWDQAFFAVGPTLNVEADQIRQERLTVLAAELHYRGFSNVYSPDDKLPDLYDYDFVLPQPLFTNVHEGDFTRYGDVTELLTAIDDRFVVLAPGDEIAVEFPAIMLPELPTGWVRDFVFEAEGWIKDGDLRTLTGERVAPLPFHAMSTYPYENDENYPDDSLHRSWVERFQTRTLPPWGRSSRQP